MVARQFAGRSLMRPLGRRTRALSSILASRTAEFPPERANLPPSPGRASTLQIGVPSGISERLVTLPGLRDTLSPNDRLWPIDMPSGAAMCSMLPSSNLIFANGAVWAGLCTRSTTTPIWSYTRGILFEAGNRWLETLFLGLDPRRCERVRLPILSPHQNAPSLSAASSAS